MLTDDPQWPAALAAASSETDPGSLGAADRLRRRFTPDLAAAALTQVALRRRARSKLPRADSMLFTRDGLEQATRASVAEWRAQRFVAAGEQEVWDLGCGLGIDAMAMVEVGLDVHAVELDPQTAALATANLALVGGRPVAVGRAEDASIPGGAAVFLDPARRTDRGRTWRVEDLSPSWDFVLRQLAADRFTCVKLGPGFPKELIPDGVQATWVSHGGDVVETSLWNRLPAGPRAIVMGRDGSIAEFARPADPRPLEVRDVGRYVIEPDNAVIRAGLVSEAAPGARVWLLDDHLAYLSSDEPVIGPGLTTFEVAEVLPYDERLLRRVVGERRIGTLEIKVRGLEVDPAVLRKALRPRGSAEATLILSRSPGGAVAVLAQRLVRPF